MEYEEGKYRVDRVCEFENASVENEFLRRDRSNILKPAQIMLLILGVVFFMFNFVDYYNIGTGERFMWSAIIRLAVLMVCIVMAFAIHNIRKTGAAFVLVSFAELACFFAYMVLLYIQKYQGFMQQTLSVILLILAAFLIPNHWKNCVLNGIVMCVGFLLISQTFIEGTAPVVVATEAVFLVIALVGLSIFLYSRELAKRRQYANERLLEHLTETDKLTGAYNRYKLESSLKNQIEYAEKMGIDFAVMLFDLDDFKRVNDIYGHAAGDEVLMETADLLRQNIRKTDVFARWGGEEFVVLFEGADLELAGELAERIRQEMEGHRFRGVGHVTVSIGLTQYQHTDDEFTVLQRADDLMYDAKAAGKNVVVSDVTEREETVLTEGEKAHTVYDLRAIKNTEDLHHTARKLDALR